MVIASLDIYTIWKWSRMGHREILNCNNPPHCRNIRIYFDTCLSRHIQCCKGNILVGLVSHWVGMTNKQYHIHSFLKCSSSLTLDLLINQCCKFDWVKAREYHTCKNCCCCKSIFHLAMTYRVAQKERDRPFASQSQKQKQISRKN